MTTDWERVATSLTALCAHHGIDPKLDAIVAACTTPASITRTTASRLAEIEKAQAELSQEIDATAASIDRIATDDGLDGVDRMMLRKLSEEIDDNAHGRAEIDRAEQTVRGLSLRRIALALEGIEDHLGRIARQQR